MAGAGDRRGYNQPIGERIFHWGWMRRIILVAVVVCWVGSAGQSTASPSEQVPSPAGQVIEVKFRDSAEVRGSSATGFTAVDSQALEEINLLVSLSDAGAVEPLVAGISQNKVSSLSDKAQDKSGKPTPDMSSWYRILLPAGADTGSTLELVRASPIVSSASMAPEAVPPPTTPDFSLSQLHLDPAPVGTDTEWARANEPRARGGGVKVVDLEYYWTASHEDLQLPASADLGGTTYEQYTVFDDEHGTAVFGIIAAKDNGFGVTGGVPEVTMAGISPIEAGFGYNPSGALTFLASKVTAGDVVLIEQQTPGPGGDLVPVEWEQSSFDAIKNLSNLGVVVVETGGNGGRDLDDAAFSGRFNRNVRDSDAIIVGAGSSADHAPLFYTSRGSRVDLQGYGENVVTTGGSHSFLQGSGPGERNIRYTSDFNGTSSAGPVVVNAVAAIQSYRKAAGAGPMTADQIAAVLKQTGTPQGSPELGNIGPLPDISAALFEADADAPVIQADRQGNIVSLSADDGWGWGVAGIEYRLNGGAWTPYTNPVDVTGLFEFEYRASDLKGNVGDPVFIQVAPRPPPPVTRIKLSLKSAAKVRAGRKLSLTATLSNGGDTDVFGLVVKATVPKRLAAKPKPAKVAGLDSGDSAKRTIKVPVKRTAKAGSKMKVKGTATAAGKVLGTATRNVKVTG